MNYKPKRLYCPVHMVWHEPDVTVCPIAYCRTKLVDGWAPHGAFALPEQIEAKVEPEKPPRVPVWERNAG